MYMCVYICRDAAGVDKENVESPAVKLGNPRRKLYAMRAGILTQLSMTLSEMISRDIRLSSLINLFQMFRKSISFPSGRCRMFINSMHEIVVRKGRVIAKCFPP